MTFLKTVLKYYVEINSPVFHLAEFCSYCSANMIVRLAGGNRGPEGWQEWR